MQNETILKPEDRTRCEVWTRVMGYHRPTTSFNIGKQGEYKDRVFFREETIPWLTKKYQGIPNE